MAQQSHDALARAVIERLAACEDPRFKQVMTLLIEHLHAFIRDADLRPEEWLRAVEFLIATGQACSEARRDFTLLADILGASTLITALDQARAPGDDRGAMTASTATRWGPRTRISGSELPLGSDIGEGVLGDATLYYGRVTDVDGRPLQGALLDTWSSHGGGGNVQSVGQTMSARGRFLTDAEGRYWFWSIKPGCHSVPIDGPVGHLLERMGRDPYQPGHIHLEVSAAGHTGMTTNLFVADGPCISFDAAFNVGDNLTVEFDLHAPGEAMDGRPMRAPYWSANHDFRLLPARG